MALWSTELPAQSTQLRQVVSLSLSTLRASRQLEASGAHCHRHARLHRLNTGQGLANQATWTFFNQRTSKPENVKAHTENCS